MWIKRTARASLAAGVLWLATWLAWRGEAAAAQPGPTLTPTPPTGPQVISYQDDPVNVRNGPGTNYDQVGILIKGQSAPIVGIAQVGQFTWFKIVYIGGPDNTGWVYKDVVRVTGDLLAVPTVIPPPTPTVRPTPTPGASLAEGSPTPSLAAPRLPTFTAPAPVVRPTLLPAQGVQPVGGLPPALIIVSLFVIGLLGGVASLLRRR